MSRPVLFLGKDASSRAGKGNEGGGEKKGKKEKKEKASKARRRNGIEGESR